MAVGCSARVFWIEIALIGAVVGFLGGMFGKGGSAIATPILAAIGVPPIAAVASPLPATIPGMLVASRPYAKSGKFDRRVLVWSAGVGIVATIIGAVATRWIDGSILVKITDVIIAALGLKFLVAPSDDAAGDGEVARLRAKTIGVGAVVGLAAGLLANSGGFLLAPLYIAVLRLPVKTAFGTSLVVATLLAVPGTIVHAALGHIDWAVVACFGVASIPLSAVGARVALRTRSDRLERIYGGALFALGVGFLVFR
ncbi:MAG: sulfite exporter TauE/SafE family protein [Actinobacteria bacterium]|nr:sulfite exporter TauE/SafE family protein [Actinomycetota bacterium]